MKKLIFLILLIPQICFAQVIVQNRDIKQHPATKLFISGNHLTSDFEDASASNNQITKYADAKTVNETSTTNPKYFPVGQDKGIYFDGTGDYLSLADSDDWFINGDYTFDTWFYFRETAGYKTIFSQAENGTNYIYFNYINKLCYFEYKTNSVTHFYISGGTFPANEGWNHLALIFRSGVAYIYLNGSFVNSASVSGTPINIAQTLYLGRYHPVPYPYPYLGHMQNIRFTKGKALWTSNFTPPPLNSTYATDSYTKLYIKGHDKAVNTTAMTDDSGTSKTITTLGDTKVGYSRGVASYFDGTGDYLSCPRIDAGNYNNTTSVEFWYYPLSVTGVRPIVQSYGNKNGAFAVCANSTSIQMYKWTTDNNNAILYATKTSALTANAWHHIYIEWLNGSGSVNFYINGVKTNIATAGTTTTSTMTLTYIGYSTDSGLSAVQGYLVGLKVSEANTTPYYSGAFTPPETEPTADQYTKFLLKQKMLKIPDIATNKTITINGQTMNRRFAKVGKSSVYFNGSDAFLAAGANVDYYFDNDGTIDFWYYYNSSVTNFYAFGHQVDNANFLGMYLSTASTSYLTYTTVAAITWTQNTSNKWNHAAVVKSGTTLKTFINGIQVGSTATGVSALGAAAQALDIGRRVSGYAFGYIQDFRITKGKALWTSNFTPPRRSGAF